MARPFVVVALVGCLAGGVAACGGVSGDAGASGRVQAWRVDDPYLPPPDPASYGRADAPAVASAPAVSDAAAASDEDRPAAGAPASTTAAAGNEDRPAAGAATSTTAAAGNEDRPAAGAPSDAQVSADLRRAYGGKQGTNLDAAAIDSDGLAVIPDTAPPKLVALMHAANDVATKPYVYGGGHGRLAGEIWTDSAYDCSGSVSYALAAAGYLKGPETSGTLMSFGKPGPGRWVTIYANAGHTFMVVAGLRYDTSGRQVTGTRWQPADARSYEGFTVRHPVGL